MTTTTLTKSDAYSIASLMHLTDKDTDALSAVVLRTFRNNTTAMATNRYTLGKLRVDSTGEDSAKDYGLTVAACKFIMANTKTKRGEYGDPVTIEVDSEQNKVTINAGGITYSDTYPAKLIELDKLDNLVEEWQPLEAAIPVRLSTKLIEQLTKLCDGFVKSDSWILELGANAYNANKPGTVRATIDERFTVLIQPRLDR